MLGQAIYRSCFDMEFYRKVRQESWVHGLSYLAKLLLVVTVIVMAFVGPAIYAGLGQLGEYVGDKVPDGASFTVRDGKLTAVMEMPINLGTENDKFIVDTSVTSLEMAREQLGEMGVLIGEDTVYLRRSEVEERVYSLKDMPNFSVNKREALNWLGDYRLIMVIVFTLVSGLFYYVAVTFGNFLFVVFGAMLASALSRMMKFRITYRQWLASGLYALTLPLLLGAIFDALGWNRIPVFPVVFFMIMASILADERARVAEAPPADPPKPPVDSPENDKA